MAKIEQPNNENRKNLTVTSKEIKITFKTLALPLLRHFNHLKKVEMFLITRICGLSNQYLPEVEDLVTCACSLQGVL